MGRVVTRRSPNLAPIRRYVLGGRVQPVHLRFEVGHQPFAFAALQPFGHVGHQARDEAHIARVPWQRIGRADTSDERGQHRTHGFGGVPIAWGVVDEAADGEGLLFGRLVHARRRFACLGNVSEQIVHALRVCHAGRGWPALCRGATGVEQLFDKPVDFGGNALLDQRIADPLARALESKLHDLVMLVELGQIPMGHAELAPPFYGRRWGRGIFHFDGGIVIDLSLGKRLQEQQKVGLLA